MRPCWESVALLGTNAANAAINLDATDKSKAAATYAEETVTATVSSDATGTFYEVMGGAGNASVLNVFGAIGVGATQDTEVEVKVDLTNMVFGKAVTAGSIALYPAPTAPTVFTPASPQGTNKLLGGGERAVIAGGGAGTSSVTFHISNQETEALLQSDIVYLTVETLGVVKGCGSVTVRAENTVSETSASSTYMDAVCVARGIREVVTPSNPITEVVRSYTDFGLHDARSIAAISADGRTTTLSHDPASRRYADSLGSINIMIRAAYLSADDGMQAQFGDALIADAFQDESDGEDEVAAARRNAGIQFVGMFDELEPSSVYLNDSPECDRPNDATTATPSIYTPPDPDRGITEGQRPYGVLERVAPNARHWS